MTDSSPAPWRRLTRHFFGSLFDLGVLSDLAAESFKRLIFGICAAFFSVGLLLARAYMVKYVNLAGLPSPDRYQAAILADHALFMALPMWVVAMATTLVGHALFPDEIDYRVLKSLPVAERTIFVAKLLALGLFIALFVAGTHLAVAPLFLISSVGHWAEPRWLLHAASFELANLLASAFAALSVVAAHGLLISWAPRGRLLAVSAATRSLLACALVLTLPFVARLPAQEAAFAGGDAWLLAVPPAWFVGVERWLLGQPTAALEGFALAAIAALALVIVITAACYALLYRRFDLVILRAGRGTRRERAVRYRRRVSSPSAATRRFTIWTLQRSVLHQGVVVALASIAVGLVLNSLVGSDLAAWWLSGREPTPALTASVVWAPFVLIFIGCLAVRTALALPAELRANWVFRITERPDARVNQLESPANVLRVVAVIAPTVCMLPLQFAVIGNRAGVTSVTALVFGWLWSELLLRDWRRLPFTCSYVPGKTFVPQLIVMGLLSFSLFTSVGTTVVWVASRSLLIWTGILAVLVGTTMVLRRRRRWWAREISLAFEDELPTEIHPLRLS